MLHSYVQSSTLHLAIINRDTLMILPVGVPLPWGYFCERWIPTASLKVLFVRKFMINTNIFPSRPQSFNRFERNRPSTRNNNTKLLGQTDHPHHPLFKNIYYNFVLIFDLYPLLCHDLINFFFALQSLQINRKPIHIEQF